MRQFSLLTTQTDLRLRNIAALRLPAVTVEDRRNISPMSRT